MIPSTHWLWASLAFILAALVGSFLNVVVHRLPLGESVVSPGSRCGACRREVPFYHNIPVLSWFILRGRCAFCKTRFSIRYPMVEAAVGALGLAIWIGLVYPADGSTRAPLESLLVSWGFLFFFVADLMAIALIDLDTMRIPDALSLPGIMVGILAAWLVGDVIGVSVEQSILGVLIGGGTLLVVTYGYFALTGREGMGLGDYRLMAMVGAFLGWQSLLFLLVASALQGIVFALTARFTGLDQHLPHPDDMLPGEEPDEPEPDEPDQSIEEEDDRLRHMAIPFGPFIALAALEWLLFEPWLMELFNSLVFRPGS
ncbi:MAG: leader peptidase (prepilin peptidase)/N-methyltransferase [Myxococcota bacterium]